MVPKLPPSGILSVGGSIFLPPNFMLQFYNLIFLMFGILVQLT